MCKTEEGNPNCRVDWPQTPPHPITCLLENVCITGPKTIAIYSNSTLHAAFNGVQLSTESLNEERHRGVLYKPMQFHHLPKSEKPTDDSLFDPVTGIISGYTNNNNPGHIWGDIVWPVFRMMYAFSAENDPFQFLLRVSNAEEFEHGGKAIYTKFLTAVTGRPYIVLGESDTDYSPKCYKRIFIGSTHLSYSEGNQEARALIEFRNFLFTRLGYDPSSIAGRTHPKIVILMKHVAPGNSQCALGNVPEIVEYIQKKYPKAEVVTVSWMGMPLLQQIETMQSSDIVISHPGSDIMNGIFLKDKATIFVPCRKLPQWGIDLSNEVRIWYKIAPFMNVVELCGDEDVTYKEGISHMHVSSLDKYFPSVVHDWYVQNDLTPP